MSLPPELDGFLCTASILSLEDLERFSLDRAAKHRRKAMEEIAKWVHEATVADLARQKLEELRSQRMYYDPLQECFDFMYGPREGAAVPHGHVKRAPQYRVAAD